MSLPAFTELSEEEVVASYGLVLAELRRRTIIRTQSVLGDLGEYLVAKVYNETPNFSNLVLTQTGTQNVDAMGRDGKRYNIKSVTGSVTGVVHGMPAFGNEQIPEQLFDFMVIAKFTRNIQLQKIVEIPWEKFIELKRWHSVMKAWNLPVNQRLLAEGKIIFSNDQAV
jgi:hypothetical protein